MKRDPSAPAGFFDAEADGLAWLAEPRAVPVVEVLAHDAGSITLERLDEAAPTARAARELGANLARLHDAGAPGFGWTPSAAAWFGPLTGAFAVPTTSHDSFTSFWVEDRLRPLARRVSHALGDDETRAVHEAIDAIATGAFDGIAGQGRERPARVHGDLWSGNVLWTVGGATLIDPAAHGGHRLEDLALLTLFGAPHLEEILAGYEEAHPMPSSWRKDLPAHLFFCLLAHVALFGGGYAGQAVATARRITARAGRIGA
ncbi:fructosamine kinase family protein [Brachybacterium huguangmaarense]